MKGVVDVLILHISKHIMKKQIIAFLMVTVMSLTMAGCAKTATTASPSPSADMTHAIRLTGVLNTRDIGGYKTADGKTVKAGMLLRTGALGGANDADKKILPGSKVYKCFRAVSFISILKTSYRKH